MWMLVRWVAWELTHALTDSAFAETGSQYIARGGSPLRLAHSDLWQDTAAALATWENNFSVGFRMLTHTLEDNVDRGRARLVERQIYRRADQSACDCADDRLAPAQALNQVLKQLAAVRASQAMTVEILHEGTSATPLPGRRAGFSRGEKAHWAVNGMRTSMRA